MTDQAGVLSDKRDFVVLEAVPLVQRHGDGMRATIGRVLAAAPRKAG